MKFYDRQEELSAEKSTSQEPPLLKVHLHDIFYFCFFPGPDSENSTAGTGQPGQQGQYSRDRTARTVQPGQDNQNTTARAGQPEHET